MNTNAAYNICTIKKHKRILIASVSYIQIFVKLHIKSYIILSSYVI